MSSGNQIEESNVTSKTAAKEPDCLSRGLGYKRVNRRQNLGNCGSRYLDDNTYYVTLFYRRFICPKGIAPEDFGLSFVPSRVGGTGVSLAWRASVRTPYETKNVEGRFAFMTS
jgi:hypothetical protein